MANEKIVLIGSGNFGSAMSVIIGNNASPTPVKMWVYEETLPNGEKLTNTINKYVSKRAKLSVCSNTRRGNHTAYLNTPQGATTGTYKYFWRCIDFWAPYKTGRNDTPKRCLTVLCFAFGGGGIRAFSFSPFNVCPVVLVL